MSKRVKIAIFISGRGSNMVSLLKACKAPDFPATPVLILSNNAQAAGLQAARQAGIPTVTLVRDEFSTRKTYDTALNDALNDHDVGLVCLAGFMQILSKDFVEKWRDRIINIHPSLLPCFKGLDTHERAIAAGVKFTGCTVHYVRFEMDTGPIIAQAVVPVRIDDTAQILAERVLKAEHRLYPQALKLVVSGDIRVEGDCLINNSRDVFESDPPTFFSLDIDT